MLVNVISLSLFQSEDTKKTRWLYLDVLSQMLDLLLELGLLRAGDLELHRQVSKPNLEFGFRDF
jgi:hypothetical protein